MQGQDANQNATRPVSIPALSDSIRNGHRIVADLEDEMNEIFGILTGSNAGVGITASPSSGLVQDASELAVRLGLLFDMARSIRHRLSEPVQATAAGSIVLGRGQLG